MRKPDFVAWEQQRPRPVCTSMQSDKYLCYSLSAKYESLTWHMQTFYILASLCSWVAWSELHLVANPKALFSFVLHKIIPYLNLWAKGISSLMKFQSKLVAPFVFWWNITYILMQSVWDCPFCTFRGKSLNFLNYCAFLSHLWKFVLILANSADPDEMQHYGSSVFAKVPTLIGFLLYKGLKKVKYACIYLLS